jgi:hypothetical protein
MPLVKITSAAIATGSITGPALGLNSVGTNNFVAGSVTSNVFALNSVTTNLLAVGAVTSNALASNLSISVSRVSETLNINTSVVGDKSASGTNVNIDVLNTTVYYFSSNTTGNVTFNLRGNTTTTFDRAVQVGNTVSVVINLRHNTAAGRAQTNMMIDGGLIVINRANPDIAGGNTIFYAGNTIPTYSTITTLESNVVGISIFKKAANSYQVLYSNTLFGLA